jgi:putative tryptophan/tyrosine transport system substrate-binding protein
VSSSVILGGAVAWPLAARAQQAERVRRIGALMPWAADNQEANDRISAFQRELQQLGWANGRNIRLELRWAAGNVDDTRKQAEELVALAPDVILPSSSSSMVALFYFR